MYVQIVLDQKVQTFINCHKNVDNPDFIKQLYEYFFLNKNEIKKKQKNISSDLLASISKPLTTEDISVIDMHTVAYN